MITIFHTLVTSSLDGPRLSRINFPEYYVNTLSMHIIYRMVQHLVNRLTTVRTLQCFVNFFFSEFTKMFRNKTYGT
jgi:hypothetical protein